MAKYEVLKSRIEKSFKLNETAGTIYEKYIKTYDEITKESALKIIMEFADIETTNYQIRGKALAILRFLKINSVGTDTSIYYKDFDLIKYGTDIPNIIENNCKWIIEKLSQQEVIIGGNENSHFYNIIAETILCISNFKIKGKLIEDFLTFVFDNLKLEEKKASNQLTVRENYWENWDGYLYNQILRVKKEIM